MLVWAKALRRPGTIRSLLARHRFLIDRRSDLPYLRPREFLTPGTMPWLPRMPKVHLIYMRPPKAWPGDRAALALDAARLLEERDGVMLDWAVGIGERSGAVWLFAKTWALEAGTWRRVFWRPGPEDLAALRRLAPGVKDLRLARKRMRVKRVRRRTR